MRESLRAKVVHKKKQAKYYFVALPIKVVPGLFQAQPFRPAMSHALEAITFPSVLYGTSAGKHKYAA